MSKTVIKIDPADIRKSVRDERIKEQITSTGGVARVYTNRKKAVKSDVVGRKAKYKPEAE